MFQWQVFLVGLTLASVAVGGVKHIELVKSSPAADTVLTDSPTELVLTFSADLDMARSAVTLRGPEGGVTLSDVRPAGDARTFRVKIEAELEAGSYLVSWTAAPTGDHGGRGRSRFLISDLGVTLPSPLPANPTSRTAARIPQ